MPYYTVDTKDAQYQIKESENYFVDFDAGSELIRLFKQHLDDIEFSIDVVSLREGKNSRKEALYKIYFSDFRIPTSFVYVFQTESGGRWNALANGIGEARIQWRSHDQWKPDIKSIRPALRFCEGSEKHPFINCFIFSIYKRFPADEDVVISAAYPTLAKDVEVNSKSNKSIQFRIEDIRSAYLHGISFTEKTNEEYVIHFRPEKLLWYMQNRDLIHDASSDYINKLFEQSGRSA